MIWILKNLTMKKQRIKSLNFSQKMNSINQNNSSLKSTLPNIAAIFDELPKEQMLLLFRLLPKEEAAETFVELDGDMQEALITAFSDTELKEVIDELYLDDTVDIIEEMPATVVKRILKNTDVL